MTYNRKVVEAFLDQETNDAVGVENEVGTPGVLVADHAADS